MKRRGAARGRSGGAGRRRTTVTAAAAGKGSISPPMRLPLPLDLTSCAVAVASRFQKLLDGEKCLDSTAKGGGVGGDDVVEVDENDCILSQDFFCTPDYITPDAQQLCNNFESNKENMPCPKSPEKLTTVRKRQTQAQGFPVDSVCTSLPYDQQSIELKEVLSELDKLEAMELPSPAPASQKKRSYVPQSAIALRCRVMPPPCLRNPFSNDDVLMDLDLFCNRKPKSSGLSYPVVGGDGLSRYHTDFHEIEQIGSGSFSHVFKVLKRIDGCMYAVKHSIKPLHQDTERRRALMEVQALAALGYHENIVGYHTSWFENEKLCIQMELCDNSLSMHKFQALAQGDILEVVYQIAKALQFIHEHGIAHLDVKPDNIYVKNGIYKLGDFGFATLMNRTLPIEEGDSRYMPLEILNENYEYLDKVDIFSLGATAYELVRGSPLPDSGAQFVNLREGKIALLPGYSMQFQNLLKAMMDSDPIRRPSAKEVLKSSIFDKVRRTGRAN